MAISDTLRSKIFTKRALVTVLTLDSISASLKLLKIKTFVQGLLKNKILKLAPKNIIFEVLNSARGNSQFFMKDLIFKSKNTHSGQISRF